MKPKHNKRLTPFPLAFHPADIQEEASGPGVFLKHPKVTSSSQTSRGQCGALSVGG